MAGWSVHRGMAVGLPFEGIDTDQLIPARFMSTPRSAGYGSFLLYDLRRTEGGALDPDFPLNQKAASGASIIVSRRNFGGGTFRGPAVRACRGERSRAGSLHRAAGHGPTEDAVVGGTW